MTGQSDQHTKEIAEKEESELSRNIAAVHYVVLAQYEHCTAADTQ